jgi:hypothetical protein
MDTGIGHDKVYGGEIHAAEAIMRGMPTGTASGWDVR